MANKATGLGFMDLPPELRQKIYRYLFVIGKVDFVRMAVNGRGHYTRETPLPGMIHVRWDPPKGSRIRATTQLLRTCKTVFAEALPIFYGENTFIVDIHDSSAQGQFGKAIGKKARALIKHIRLEKYDLGNHWQSKSRGTIFKPLRGLRVFDFSITQDKAILTYDAIRRGIPHVPFLQEVRQIFPLVELRLRVKHERKDKRIGSRRFDMYLIVNNDMTSYDFTVKGKIGQLRA
ncbi:hypothetical protein EJ08DRAFT_645467 [Tothia fuscella]|uniref:DUF7730 domain-containing protein n=1 Tax=Tothia fuscella TaxID=1048955 RepID=A0A9P4P345_9PEZI|nr:hypothetical protein EJ08DRAFT_645467 [Tothia fuscella]